MLLEACPCRKKKQIALIEEILDAIPIAVAYKDADTRFLGVNRAFEELHDTRRADITGKRVYETGYLSSEECTFRQEWSEKAAQSSAMLRIQRQMFTKDGQLHYILFHLQSISTGRGATWQERSPPSWT